MGALRLNGVEVPARVIEGLGRLSSLRGVYGRLGRPQVWLRETPAAERLLAPGLGFDWMLDDHTEYFTPEELSKANQGLCAALQGQAAWLRAVPGGIFGSDLIDPARVVFIGFNLLEDSFFALYRIGHSLALIAQSTHDRTVGWNLVYDDIGDFLRAARVEAIL